MSNNIYTILNNFNKVAQEPQQPATQTQPKAKTRLQENMDQVLSEKYMGFKKTVAAVKKGGADNPEAVAASIGRKKYGKEKFQKAAAAGKKLGEQSGHVQSTATGFKATAPQGKRLSVTLDPSKKLTPSDVKLKADNDSAENKKDMSEGEVEESGLQAYLGKKKYGEQGMKALQKAGRDGASKETMAKIRAKHDKMDEAAKPDYIDLDKDGNKDEPMKKAAKDAKSKKVQEVAPPGAKAERMVKHIKKGYAKDGKVTKTEKSKAYGAAWKAHNKGKVEEAIKAMMEAGFTKEQIVEGWDDMMKAVANRSNDMKTGEKRQGAKGEIEKTASGIKHTRRYDRKTGETETGSDGEQVKRSRGRPKKSQFESVSKDSTTINKMIVETFRDIIEGSIQGGVWTSNPPKKGQPNVPVPQNIDGGSVSPAPKTPSKPAPSKSEPPMGSIKGGVWTSTPPKSGEKGVPVPVPVDEADMEEGNAFGGAVAKAKADGVQPGETIKVGGKTYPVKEGEELLQMLRIAGIKILEDTQLDECGMSAMGNGMMGQHEQEGRMNVSTNMSSDGTKSVTITADGNSATELMQMLKLAGMGGNHEADRTEPEGVLVVSTDDDEEVEENLEVRANPAGASSIEQAKKIGAQFPQQNGKEPNLAYKIGEEDVEENLKVVPNPSTASSADQAKKLGSMMPAPAGEKDPIATKENLKVVPNPSTATSVDQAKKLGSMMPAPPGEKDPIATKEAKDERYHASTTPDEHVMPVQAQTKGGDGDVAGKEKKMTPHGYQFGDNPQAMKESMSLKLIKEYETIKVKK